VSDEFSKRRRQRRAYADAGVFRAALDRVRQKLDAETFARFICDYHRHWMIAAAHNEQPLPASKFYADWASVQASNGAPEQIADDGYEPARDYQRQFAGKRGFDLKWGE
jgi:hypothetical protein